MSLEEWHPWLILTYKENPVKIETRKKLDKDIPIYWTLIEMILVLAVVGWLAGRVL